MRPCGRSVRNLGACRGCSRVMVWPCGTRRTASRPAERLGTRSIEGAWRQRSEGDMRRFNRVNLEELEPVRCRLPFGADVINVGLGGLLLSADQPLPLGQKVG